MAVQAKFYVTEVSRRAQQGGEFSGETVKLQAAMGEDNKSWSQWTPSGSVEMWITNSEAAKQFIPGQYVMVTFEPVPMEAPKTP